MPNTQCHCNTCQGHRAHEVLCEVSTSDLDEEHGVGMVYRHEMLKCAGCSSIVLRRTSHFTEDHDDHDEVELFPPATSRRPPRWLDDLRDEKRTRGIHDILKEVYVGLQNGMRHLAAMGMRSVLEQTMVKSVGDQGTFKGTLHRFAEQHGLHPEQVRVLNIVLDAGHAATHRAYCPTDDALHTCIDITESIIQSIYILPKKAVQLRKNIPRRVCRRRPVKVLSK